MSSKPDVPTWLLAYGGVAMCVGLAVCESARRRRRVRAPPAGRSCMACVSCRCLVPV